MQRAGIEAVSEHNLVPGRFRVCRKIDRFVVAFNQTGIKIVKKAALENIDQLLIMVCGAH